MFLFEIKTNYGSHYAINTDFIMFIEKHEVTNMAIIHYENRPAIETDNNYYDLLDQIKEVQNGGD